MKQRFLEANTEMLSLDEILTKLKVFDLPKNSRMVLDNEMLTRSPKLKVRNVDGVNKFTFIPKYKIRNNKELLQLIRNRHKKYGAGIPIEDIAESVPNAEKKLEVIDEVVVLKGAGGVKIAFYNEKKDEDSPSIEQEYISYWKSISVDALNDMAIEEYLVENGHNKFKSIMKTTKTMLPPSKRKMKPKKFLNDHLGNILINYPDISRDSH